MGHLKAYLARALELPPHVAVRKAGQLVVRTVRAAAETAKDRARPSYGAHLPLTACFSVTIDDTSIDAAARRTLGDFVRHYMRHEFDLLGSGWVRVAYGADVAGLEGVRFGVAPDLARSVALGTPAALVSRSNRAEARRIFDLIDDRGYEAIDWQRDFRSGFRWRADTPWRELAIGRDRGADIKWPWELSRMQHLPQLALAAIVAPSDASQFEPRARYVQEIRSQVLDFIAANPPRFGACWGCPMDVGIRAANWALTLGLLSGHGLAFDAPFLAELTRGLHDHATFIAANLEWSEQGRSNHYLSDLTGLLFAAAALPRTPETATCLNFSGRALAGEVLGQFHGDGGNYEGSTSYHRLSGELAVYGLALVAGLTAAEPALFDAQHAPTLAVLKASLPDFGTPIAEVLAAAAVRLGPMLSFTRAMVRPDGDIVQIGDTDSGRLFKLLPIASPGDGLENHLRADELIGALAQACDGATGPGLSATLVRALARGERLGASSEPTQATDICEKTTLQALAAQLSALPETARRTSRMSFKTQLIDTPRLSAFPEFGLYRIDAPGFLLAFRCARHDRRDAPGGHTHDDNLGIELVVDGEHTITDPGTYVYTSFPELRNAYRGSGAHFAPRANEFATVLTTDYLFQMKHAMTARCLYASPWALAGVLEGPPGKIYRIIELDKDGLTITDAVEGGTLASVSGAVTVAMGYGKKTARPAFDV